MNKIKHIVVSTMTLISPMLNTRFIYRLKFGKPLDLKNPKTLNDKILWLKFNTYKNNPVIKQCADKYAVREYMKRKDKRLSVLSHYAVAFHIEKQMHETMGVLF